MGENFKLQKWFCPSPQINKIIYLGNGGFYGKEAGKGIQGVPEKMLSSDIGIPGGILASRGVRKVLKRDKSSEFNRG